MKIDKELIKKSYSKEQLQHMLTEIQATIMAHAQEISRIRRQQEQLVRNADVIAEVLGELLTEKD